MRRKLTAGDLLWLDRTLAEVDVDKVKDGLVDQMRRLVHPDYWLLFHDLFIMPLALEKVAEKHFPHNKGRLKMASQRKRNLLESYEDLLTAWDVLMTDRRDPLSFVRGVIEDKVQEGPNGDNRLETYRLLAAQGDQRSIAVFKGWTKNKVGQYMRSIQDVIAQSVGLTLRDYFSLGEKDALRICSDNLPNNRVFWEQHPLQASLFLRRKGMRRVLEIDKIVKNSTL